MGSETLQYSARGVMEMKLNNFSLSLNRFKWDSEGVGIQIAQLDSLFRRICFPKVFKYPEELLMLEESSFKFDFFLVMWRKF